MKSLYWVFTTFCILTCSILLFKTHNNQKRIQENLDSKNLAYNSVISILLKNLKHSKNLSFTDSLKIIDNDGQIQKLTNAFDNQPKMVLKISQKNCEFCVESAINSIIDFQNNYSEKIPLIILITSDLYTSNTIKALETSYKNRFRFFFIKEKDYGNNLIESINLPYFFLLKKGKYHGGLFIPDAYNQNLTKEYLRMIEKEFFRSDMQK